jgi:nitroreductase
VSDEVLSVILNAGIEAPSGYNLQPWRQKGVAGELSGREARPLVADFVDLVGLDRGVVP